MENQNIRLEQNPNPEMIPPMEQPMVATQPVVREPYVAATPMPIVVKKQTRRRKRCSKGKRRNPKTHRCNKKCPPGYNRSKTSRRCVKK